MVSRGYLFVMLLLVPLTGGLACAPRDKVELASTQVMLRVFNNDETLINAMSALRAQLFLKRSGTWDERSDVVIEKKVLKWPVDLPVLPPARDSRAELELVIEALGPKGKVLARTRVVTMFAAGERKVLEVWLFVCPGHEAGFVCPEEEDCHGPSCAVCIADGSCAAVGKIESDTLADLDPTEDPTTKPNPRADAGDEDGFAIAEVGSRCDARGAKACEGENSSQPLTCAPSGTWDKDTPCEGHTRCQSRLSAPLVGTCQDIVAGCVGKAPFELTCEGDVPRACSANLLTYEDAPPCDVGFICSGDECVNVDECIAEADPCTHGGVCHDATPGYSCTGCTEGSVADGALLERCVDVDECTAATVCTADYPCENRDPDYTCRGLFPEWSVSHASTFTVKDGVVTDLRTGLQWQQVVVDSGKTWSDAVTSCADLTLGGYRDWRLPTITEHESIVDYNRYDPAIDVEAFPNTPSLRFWTSSPVAGSDGEAWTIGMGSGVSVGFAVTYGGYRSRCVRP